jgi:hypothetical protein
MEVISVGPPEGSLADGHRLDKGQEVTDSQSR